MTAINVLAALSADPQIRGAVIVLTAFAILCGSVFLLLMTNTGAKLGVLLSLAGLFGWCAVMGWVWVAYGIGLKGEEKAWHVEEVLTGDVPAQTTIDEAEDFPRGWQKLETGSPTLGDAQAAADRVLAPVEDSGGHSAGGESESESKVRITPPFEKLSDYVHVGGFEAGGEDYWLPGGALSEGSDDTADNNVFSKAITRLRRGWLHKPHYAVIQVRPALPMAEGEVGNPEPDTSRPLTYVLMVRDLGSLRVPSFVFAVAMSILFGVVAYHLHRRDKQIWAAREAAPATT